MATQLAHKPHISNVTSGMQKYDPMHSAIFEVQFSLPTQLQSRFQQDEALLTEQVTEVSGLDALQKTTAAGSQKFLGVDVSFLNPVLDNTYADLTITLNLNIRNQVDAFVLNVFKEWSKLGYDLGTGTRTLAEDYISDSLFVAEANRNGVVWRTVKFHRVMLTGVTGLDSLNYTSNDARTLQCTFRADYWEEELAANE